MILFLLSAIIDSIIEQYNNHGHLQAIIAKLDFQYRIPFYERSFHTMALSLYTCNITINIIIISVAPIQQFAYMPIFLNPNCLYADPICVKCTCMFTHGTVLIILLCYTFSPKYIVHVVTGIFSLGCTYLQILLVQFNNNVICKA